MKVRSKAKRFFAILMSVAMIISMMPTMAFAKDGNIPVVDGVVKIEDEADLIELRTDVNGGNDYSGITIKLTGNITLTDAYYAVIGTDAFPAKDGIPWQIGGYGATPFAGTFDGGGFTISGAKTSLFGNLSGGSVVKDLTVTSSGFNGIASIARIAKDGVVAISNCSSDADITVPSGQYQAGGFVALVEADGTLVLDNCSYSGDVVGNGEDACVTGTLVGNVADGTLVFKGENSFTGTLTNANKTNVNKGNAVFADNMVGQFSVSGDTQFKWAVTLNDGATQKDVYAFDGTELETEANAVVADPDTFKYWAVKDSYGYPEYGFTADPLTGTFDLYAIYEKAVDVSAPADLKVVGGTDGTTDYSAAPLDLADPNVKYEIRVVSSYSNVGDSAELSAAAQTEMTNRDFDKEAVFEIDLYVSTDNGVTYSKVENAKLSDEVDITFDYTVLQPTKAYYLYHWNGTSLDPAKKATVGATTITVGADAFSPFVLLLGESDKNVISISTGEGYTVSYTDANPVADGGSFEFTTTVDAGYKLSKITVNGIEIPEADYSAAPAPFGEAGDYTYTITNILDYQFVNVAVTKIVPTFSVSYDANGGAPTPATLNNLKEGDVYVVSSTDVTLADNVFKGWTDGVNTYQPGDSFYMPANDVTLTAVWAAKNSVTFNAGLYDGANAPTGAVPTMTAKAEGEVFVLPAGEFTTPTEIDGTTYVMTGWDDGTTTYAAGSEYTMPNNAVTFTAQWQAIPADKAYIVYNANGGINPPVDYNTYAIVAPGNTVALPDAGAMTKDGHTFAGWNTKADGSGTDYAAAATYTFAAAGTHVLYAKWNPVATYTVEYDANGGVGTVPSDAATYESGDSFTVLDGDSLSYAGKKFAGWADDPADTAAEFVPGSSYTITADMKLYAVWTDLVSYTLKYDANGGSGSMADVVELEGEEFTVLDSAFAAPAVGSGTKTFVGWNTNAAGLGKAYEAGDPIKLYSDVTLYAQWENLNEYKVTFNAGVYAGANAPTGTVPAGYNDKLEGDVIALPSADTLITPTETDGTTYVMVGWNDGTTTYVPGEEYTMPADDVEFTAQWKAIAPDKAYIVYNANGGINPPVDYNTYAYDGSVTLQDAGAMTNAGYTFAGWKIGGTTYAAGASYSFGSVAGTHVAYAQWTAVPTHYVIYDANGANGAVPTDDTKYAQNELFEVKSGAELSKPETATTYFVFIGWSENAAWDDPSDGDLYTAGSTVAFPHNDKDTKLFAIWEEVAKDKFAVEYNFNGGTGDSTVTYKTESYVPGEDVTIQAYNESTLSKEGYVFKGWRYQSETGPLYNPGDKFEMPDEKVYLIAEWAEEYSVIYDLNGGTNGTGFTTEEYLVDEVVKVGVSKAGTDFPDPVRDGYTFVNWAYQDVTSGTTYDKGDTFPMPGENVYLIAVWKEKLALTYDANGGAEPAIVVEPLYKGDVETVAANTFTKAGETFVNWNTQPNGTGDTYKPGDSITINADTTLYAQWTTDYIITFDDNLGAWEQEYVTFGDDTYKATNGEVTITAKKNTGDYVNAPKMARVNYVFEGWYTTPECDGTKYYDGTGFKLTDANVDALDHDNDKNIKLYANWTPAYGANQVKIKEAALADATYALNYRDVYIEAAAYDAGKVNPWGERIYRNFHLTDADGNKVATGLPEGLYLNQRTGEIYGVPTAPAGTYDFYVRVANDKYEENTKENYSWISAPVKFSITVNEIDLSVDRSDKAVTDKIYGSDDPATNYVSNMVKFTVDGDVLTGTLATVNDLSKAKVTVNNADATAVIDYDYAEANTANDTKWAAFEAITAKGALLAALDDARDPNAATMNPISDTATTALERYTKYEDVGQYKLFLDKDDAKYFVAIDGTVKDQINDAVPAYYALVIAEAFADKNTKDASDNLYADKYLFDINKKAATYAATKVYGEVKNESDVTGGTWTGLVDAAGLLIKDSEDYVKAVAAIADADLSTSKHLKAGVYNPADSILTYAIKNELPNDTTGTVTWGTEDTDTTANYTVAVALTITAKPLGMEGKTVKVTPNSTVTEANVKALAGLTGVISGDVVDYTFVSATYDDPAAPGTPKTETDIAVVATDLTELAKTAGDYDVVVTFTDVLSGADATNYTLTAGTVTGKLHVANAGGGGGGGGFVEPPVLIKDDHFAYMKGDNFGNFRPDANLTRAEAATIFYNLLTDKSMGDIAVDFTDVNDGDWYAKAVNTLASRGILGGYDDGTFLPSKNITRAEFAAIASRFDDLSAGSVSFSDVTADHWAYDYIVSSATKGWITGYDDGSFKPENNITRAEVVTLVNRVLDRDPDEKYIDKNIADIKVLKDVSKDHWAYYNIIEATNGHDYSKDAKGNETWEKLQ